MSLQESIADALKAALRSGEKKRLGILRMMLTELQVARASGGPFDELAVIKAYAKKLRKAAEMGVVLTDTPLIEDEAELKVAKRLAEWPRLIEIAAKAHEPHRIAFYLYDLASDFHALWNKGSENPELRFLQEGDLAASAAKIALPRVVAVVISAGLGILGVTPVQEMR